MRPFVPILSALLLLLPLAVGAVTAPATVEGAGTPSLVSFTCGPWATPTVTHVTLVRTSTAFYEWDVIVESTGTLCPATVAAHCWGGGSLEFGVVLYNCSDGGQGEVGPVFLCAEPGQAAAVGSGWFAYESGDHRVEGPLTYAVSGDAVDEANVCR